MRAVVARENHREEGAAHKAELTQEIVRDAGRAAGKRWKGEKMKTPCAERMRRPSNDAAIAARRTALVTIRDRGGDMRDHD